MQEVGLSLPVCLSLSLSLPVSLSLSFLKSQSIEADWPELGFIADHVVIAGQGFGERTFFGGFGTMYLSL